jgi:ribosomal protein S27E
MIEKKLVSLEDYNNIRTKMFNTVFTSDITGVACPKCGEELLDTEPHFTFAGSPPQKSVHCSSCNWDGYKVA